jgi:hypothetical protein
MVRIAADDFPARIIAVSSRRRIDEKSHDGMYPNGLKKITGRLGAKSAAVACIFGSEIGQDRFLLFGSGIRKTLCARIFRASELTQMGEPRFIDRQGLAGECLKRSINEINDSGFARSGQIVGGNDLLGDGFHLTRLFRTQNLKFRGSLRTTCHLRMLSSRNNGRPLCADPRRPSGPAGSKQKLSSCFLVWCHGLLCVRSNLRLDRLGVNLTLCKSILRFGSVHGLQYHHHLAQRNGNFYRRNRHRCEMGH